MYIAIIIIVGLFLWFISKQTLKRPSEVGGKSLLRFNTIFGALGLICMVIGLFMPLYSYISDDFSTEGTLIMLGLLIFLFGIGYWLFSWYSNHKVLFDDNEITVIDSNKKERTFRWSDIKDIELNHWTSKYILTLTSDEKVGIHRNHPTTDVFQ